MSVLVIKKQLSGLDNRVLLPQSDLIYFRRRLIKGHKYDSNQNDKNG